MNKINIKEKQTIEKLRGGYYTPIELTDFIARYVSLTQNVTKPSILEPSAGDGSFYESFRNLKQDFNLTGIELLEEESMKAKDRVFNDGRFETLNEDFYKYYHDNRNKKYHYIVGNPPYIRYQFLTEEQRTYQSEILTNNEMKTNRLINSWVAFTVASIELLKENGVIAFVLPTDFLQVSYARELRSFLYKKLSQLTIINFENTVFNGIQQDVLLILGHKREVKKNECHQLRIINLKNKDELYQLNINEYPVETKESTERFYITDKWSTVFIDRNSQSFYFTLEKDEKVFKFNEFIKGEVGITTGNNKIFAITDTVRNEYNLDEYVIPLLGRSVEAFGTTYERNDLERNMEENKCVWLLDFNNKEVKGKAEDYIKLAESKDEHLGYKLGLRDLWYEVPSIWQPDAFLLRRMGTQPKIILNNINATSTDTFHRLTFDKESNPKLLVLALYSSVSLMTFELEGRIFGGGALEILPGDLKNIYLPKLDYSLFSKEIDIAFNELDHKLRTNVCFDDIVLWVNNKLINLFDVDHIVLSKSFSIWKNLQKKRMSK